MIAAHRRERAGHPRPGLGLLALALAAALGLPALFAFAPAVADAAGAAGRRALIAAAILGAAAAGAFAYAGARREGPEEARRLDRRLCLAGGVATLVVLALFPVQMSVFALAWPPPETAEQYFRLLEESRLVGLLSLDVLLMADWIVLLVVWAGLYAALRPAAPRTMLAALALVVASTAMYFLSNTAFDMVALSQQHAASTTAAGRAAAIASGEAALATFEGPWFTASYVLSGIAALVASLVMWRTPGFGRTAGGIGVAYGAMQLLPPNLGAVGMAVSLASLLPMLAWLGLVARALLRLGKGSGKAAA